MKYHIYVYLIVQFYQLHIGHVLDKDKLSTDTCCTLKIINACCRKNLIISIIQFLHYLLSPLSMVKQERYLVGLHNPSLSSLKICEAKMFLQQRSLSCSMLILCMILLSSKHYNIHSLILILKLHIILKCNFTILSMILLYTVNVSFQRHALESNIQYTVFPP